MEKWTVHLRTNKLAVRNALLLVISTTSRPVKFTNLASPLLLSPPPRLYTSRDCFRARAKPRREGREEEHARVKTSPIALPPMHRGTTTYSKLVLSLTNGEKDTGMRNEYGQRRRFFENLGNF